jgi:hypothetical protein
MALLYMLDLFHYYKAWCSEPQIIKKPVQQLSNCYMHADGVTVTGIRRVLLGYDDRYRKKTGLVLSFGLWHHFRELDTWGGGRGNQHRYWILLPLFYSLIPFFSSVSSFISSLFFPSYMILSLHDKTMYNSYSCFSNEIFIFALFNRKELEETGHPQIWSTGLFAWRDWRKPRNISVGTVSIVADIRAEYERDISPLEPSCSVQ